MRDAAFLCKIRDTTIPAGVSAPQRRIAWLIGCNYSDNTWRVQDCGSRRPRALHFDVALSRNALLIDDPVALADIKRIGWELRSGANPVYCEGFAQVSAIYDVITLRRWMCARRIRAVEDLHADDLHDYAEAAVGGIGSILDAETRIVARLDELYDRATPVFDGYTLRQKYRIASELGLPVRCDARRRRYGLDRHLLLREIGLDHISLSTFPAATRAIDEFERECFGWVKKRSARNCAEDTVSVTKQRFSQLIATFKYLYIYRRSLNDPLSFDPHDAIDQAINSAKKRLSAIQRTRSIPPEQGFACLNEAVRYVRVVARPLFRLSNAVRTAHKQGKDIKPLLRSFLKEEPGLLDIPAGAHVHATSWHHHHGGTNECALEQARAARLESTFYLDEELTKVQTACGDIIGTLAARRLSEIVSLKEGCISRDGQGRAVLSVFIHKTVREERTIPVPEVVVEAVEVLEMMSREARKKRGTDYLFIRLSTLREGLNKLLACHHQGRFSRRRRCRCA